MGRKSPSTLAPPSSPYRRRAATSFFFLLAIAVFIILEFAAVALAVQPDEMLADPKLEARARNLSRELRCMVCQNQSIDDSEAPLARDLRILVRERLRAGDSNAQVLEFLTARYGEFVLLKPSFGWHTALLWLAPAGVLMLGVLSLIIAQRRRMAGPSGVAGGAERALTASEEERLAQLLGPRAGGPARDINR
jgi:cytochrome c-type biogenesis protein CcmH